jgi:hypothetical protein
MFSLIIFIFVIGVALAMAAYRKNKVLMLTIGIPAAILLAWIVAANLAITGCHPPLCNPP